MPANLYALGAIALWVLLASLGVSLRHLPPFLLTGLALLTGSLLALPFVWQDRRAWAIPPATLALGVYGLFGYHFLLFIALRHAPPVEANLVNYLWPLFMVVLAPLFLRGVKLRAAHVLAALLGFAGAAVAILGGLAAFLFWPQKPPAPVPEPVRVQAPPPPKPEVRQEIETPPAPAPLPSLGDSDSLMLDALAGLIGNKTLMQLFHTERIIRNFVATVDNLPRRRAPMSVLSFTTQSAAPTSAATAITKSR